MPIHPRFGRSGTVSRRQALLGAAALTVTTGLFSPLARALGSDQFARLRARFKGELITPQDSKYQTARLLNNRVFDRHPAVIAVCAGTEDVARVLTFAREHQMPIAVRSGGHSWAGHSSIDNGVVIDLSNLKEVRIDREKSLVTCGAGVRVFEVNDRITPLGLALPLGVCGDVGVAGLTLGGGYGFLLGTAGLACDSLVDVRVVLSDGRIVRANDEREPDLMWALRGAGANFGIVTELTFRAQHVDRLLAGEVKFAPEQLHGMMDLVNRSAASLPDELTAFGCCFSAGVTHTPSISLCWNGDPTQGLEKIRALYQPLKPDLDTLRTTNLADFVGRGEGTDGLSCVRYGFAHGQLSASGLEALSEPAPPPQQVAHIASLDCMNGKITRRSHVNSCAARIYPGVGASLMVFWHDPGGTPAAEAWTQSAWAGVQPSTDGAYLNMLADEPAERVRMAYRESYARLGRLKSKFDPDNVLRSNQNVPPMKS